MLQSERCMDCHHTRMPRQFARSAHNLSAEELQDARNSAATIRPASWNDWLPRPAFELNDVACSACHREHGGPDASLTALSNEQCQTCHQNRFTSFAVDHPAWNEWPYVTNEPIAFDHRTHLQTHFPRTVDENGVAATFDCLTCHAKTETGQFARITNYSVACGSCHDKALNQRAGERLDLFVVPSLISPNENVVGKWPANATGFYDGKVGPLARILLAQSNAVEALSNLPGDADYSRIDPENSMQCEAAELVAVAVREAIFEMAIKGPVPAVRQTHSNDQLLPQLLKGLPPQLVWDASQRWFRDAQPLAVRRGKEGTPPLAQTPFRMAAAKGESSGDPLLDSSDVDPLLDDPLENHPLNDGPARGGSDRLGADANGKQKRTPFVLDPLKMQPAGGWYVDDSRMAISYRGHGHADPVIKAAIELAAGLAAEDPIRRELLGSGPALACMECHQGAVRPGEIVWRPLNDERKAASRFTKFSHEPHMNIPTMMDCTHCHQVAKDFVPSDEFQISTISASDLNTSSTISHDFSPLTRQACASCHTAQAAGDACIKCHVYHTEPLTGSF